MIGDIIPFDPYFVVFGFIAMFSFVYSFYGIKQPEIFGQEIEINGDEKKEPEKYTRSGLKEKQAEEYLEKPVSPEKLLTIVEKFLKKSGS